MSGFDSVAFDQGAFDPNAFEFDDTVTASLTGTALSNLTEQALVDGGRTIIITLANDTWVASGATFDAQRQNIIDGLDSDGAEPNGWNAERSNIPVTAVVRDSDTQVTITLPALPNYDITANEVITLTVPASAISGADPIVASPTLSAVAAVAFVLSHNDESLVHNALTLRHNNTSRRHLNPSLRHNA